MLLLFNRTWAAQNPHNKISIGPTILDLAWHATNYQIGPCE